MRRSACAHPVSATVIVHERGDARCERRQIAAGIGEAGLVLEHEIRGAANLVAHDDWQSARHGFVHDQPPRFAGRRGEDECIRRRVCRGDAALVLEPYRGARDIVRMPLVVDRPFQRSIADNQAPDV